MTCISKAHIFLMDVIASSISCFIGGTPDKGLKLIQAGCIKCRGPGEGEILNRQYKLVSRIPLGVVDLASGRNGQALIPVRRYGTNIKEKMTAHGS